MTSDQKATFLVRPKVTIMLAASNRSKMRNATRVRPTRPNYNHNPATTNNHERYHTRPNNVLDWESAGALHYTANYILRSLLHKFWSLHGFKKATMCWIKITDKRRWSSSPHHLSQPIFSEHSLGTPMLLKKNPFPPLLRHLKDPFNAISFLSFRFRHHAA